MIEALERGIWPGVDGYVGDRRTYHQLLFFLRDNQLGVGDVRR